MKKILIDAVMIGNLGDDLFVKVLADRYKNCEFSIIISKKYSNFLEDNKNVKCISYNKALDIIEKITRHFFNKKMIFNWYQKKHDATVLISGSAFIQNKKYIQQAEVYRNDILNANNYYILGINFGPFRNEEFSSLFKEIYKDCVDVCFRERYSYDIFSQLPNARYAPDVVFSMNTKEYHLVESKKSIGISVIDLSTRENLKKYQKDYEQTIVRIICDFVQQGYNVNLYSFCREQGDELCIERVMNDIPGDIQRNIKTIYYRGDVDEIISTLNTEEIIIATRFHAMILGWKLRKKVFPVIYSNKMLNVIKDIGFDGGYSELNQIKNLRSQVIIDTSRQLKTIELIEKEAEKQFEKIDEYMAKTNQK